MIRTATIFLSLNLVLASRLFAFANWESAAFPSHSGPSPIAPTFTYQTPHASCATGTGIVYALYVLRAEEKDHLYLVSKNSYVQTSSIISISKPTLIDARTSIRSLQIEHDSATGTTHLAYSVGEVNSPRGFLTPVEYVVHATRKIGRTPEIIRNNVTSKLFPSGAFDLSLALEPNTSAPALAIHQPGSGDTATLTYAELASAGAWEFDEVDSGPGTGAECDLSFDESGAPLIAYLYSQNHGVTARTRVSLGTWQGLNGLGSFSQSTITFGSPRIRPCDSGGGHCMIYIFYSATKHRLQIQDGSNAGVPFTIDEEDSAPRDPSNRRINDARLAVSQGRLVVSYTKSTSDAPAPRPWVAIRKRGKIKFSRTNLRPGTRVASHGPTSLSLDETGYPFITWTLLNGSIPRVTFSRDLTDWDGDGVSTLLEGAFGMNPSIPDAHKFPKPEVITNPDGSRLFDYSFLIALGSSKAVIDPETQSVVSEFFTFQAHIDSELQSLSVPSSPVDISVLNNLPPGPATVTFRSPTDLNQATGSEFLRIAVFRR